MTCIFWQLINKCFAVSLFSMKDNYHFLKLIVQIEWPTLKMDWKVLNVYLAAQSSQKHDVQVGVGGQQKLGDFSKIIFILGKYANLASMQKQRLSNSTVQARIFLSIFWTFPISQQIEAKGMSMDRELVQEDVKSP